MPRACVRGLFSEVHTLFLDEEPRVTGWADLVRAPRVVIVPFFASEGWHTLETIPQDLGLTGTVTDFPASRTGISRCSTPARSARTRPSRTSSCIWRRRRAARAVPAATPNAGTRPRGRRS